MQPTFLFDRDFQVGILSLMVQNYEFLLTAADLVQPQYFEDIALVWTFQAIRNYYVDHQMRPDQLVLINEFRKAVNGGRIKEVDAQSYIDVFKRLWNPVDSQQYIMAEVIRFCKRQEVRRAMIEMAPLTDSQDDEIWDKIESRMRQACNAGSHATNIGIQYFIDYPERLKKFISGEEQLVIPTGISDLDTRIGGGLKSGQLGIWMGGTSVGKSIGLSHCGKRAIVGKYKVVHYTLELSQEDIAQRYDASWTATPVHELRTQTVQVQTNLDNLKIRYGNSLIIKEYPAGTATVNTFRAHLNSVRNIGFIPDLVIVDYGDIMKSLTNYNNEYDDQGSIFRDLRGLASELKIPIWSACQLNRIGYGQEIADVDSIGDSFKKAQIADIVIAICATREEMELGILRLFIAKNRNGPPKHIVKIRSAYDRMAFYLPVAAPLPDAKNGSVASTAPGLPKPSRRRPISSAPSEA